MATKSTIAIESALAIESDHVVDPLSWNWHLLIYFQYVLEILMRKFCENIETKEVEYNVRYLYLLTIMCEVK